MALAITLMVNLEDETGRKSATKVRIPVSLTLSDKLEFAVAAAQLVADASSCRITNVSLTFDVDISGLGLDTVATLVSNVGKKALFLWSTATAGLGAKFTVPTIDEAIFPAGSDEMDESDPLVSPFISAIENGIAVTGPATMNFTNNRTIDIETLTDAYELHAKTG